MRERPRKLADRERDRRTVPTPDGKSWPVLFGTGATPVLMYVALHPGCRSDDIVTGTGVRLKNLRFRVNRLIRLRIIVRYRRRHSLNTTLTEYHELTAVLRSMAMSCGMQRASQDGVKGVHDPRRPATTKSPSELFVTRIRGRALMTIALLRESYTVELASVLQAAPTHVHQSLLQLELEGIIRKRLIGNRVGAYSMNPAFPGAVALMHLLRRMGRADKAVRTAVRTALLRREMGTRAWDKRAGHIAADLTEAAGSRIEGRNRQQARHLARVLQQ